MNRHRPFGVMLLAAFAAVSALIALYHTLQMFHVLPFVFGPLHFYGFDLLGGLLWGATTLIWIWAMINLWNLQAQGLMFVTILAGWNLVLDFFSILGASSFEELLPSIIVNALVLIYSLMPGTRNAFNIA
jgi:hypothetical protein